MNLSHKQQIALGVALVVACIIIAGFVDQRLSVKRLVQETEGYVRYMDQEPKTEDK